MRLAATAAFEHVCRRARKLGTNPSWEANNQTLLNMTWSIDQPIANCDLIILATLATHDSNSSCEPDAPAVSKARDKTNSSKGSRAPSCLLQPKRSTTNNSVSLAKHLRVSWHLCYRPQCSQCPPATSRRPVLLYPDPQKDLIRRDSANLCRL